MSWPLVMASHKHTVLQDELPAIVLATVELHGFATGMELAQEIKREHSSCMRAITSLYHDNLIELSGDHVGVTPLGKSLLDRMKLARPIVESIVGEFDLPEREKKEVGTALYSYRNAAFECYRDTVFNVRQFRNYLMHFAGDERIDKRSAKAGEIAVLLNDVDNWCSHSEYSGHAMSDAVIHLAGHSAKEPTPSQSDSASSPLLAARRILKTAKNPAESQLDDRSMEVVAKNLNFFWKVVKDKSTARKLWVEFKKPELAEKAQMWLVSEASGSDVVQVRRFVDAVLTSQSAEEVAAKVGVSVDEVRTVLDTIIQRCETLKSGLASKEST